MALPPKPDNENEGRGEAIVGRVLEQGDRSVRLMRENLQRVTPAPLLKGWRWLGQGLKRRLPKGLLGRSLLIIAVPMIILQTVVASVFMERHWQLVTAKLSEAMVRDIGAVVDLVNARPAQEDIAPLLAVARQRLLLDVTLLPAEELSGLGKPHFTDPLVEQTLSEKLEERLGLPFSIEVTAEPIIGVKVAVRRGNLLFRFERNLAYAANWHIFIVWMIGTALVLIIFSSIFIRNQIKPIQRLANAAEAFGKGQPVDQFVPQGAREVRKAAQAFIEMRRRIERQIEQRTTMLAGVSHDLRTLLTRFRLELALMPNEETEELRRDIDEMEAMLEAYMAFAKTDIDETALETDVARLLSEIAERYRREGHRVEDAFSGEPIAVVRPGGLRRLIGNLLANAARYGRNVYIGAEHRDGWLSILIDDDGPGIATEQREAVFKPFYRLDYARNQNIGGTGLGLAIARDVARSHGGEIRLEDSPRGGLRAIVRIPG